MVFVQTVMQAVGSGYAWYDPENAFLAEPGFVLLFPPFLFDFLEALAILEVLLVVAFIGALGFLFHSRGEETLKLWSPTSDDLQGENEREKKTF